MRSREYPLPDTTVLIIIFLDILVLLQNNLKKYLSIMPYVTLIIRYFRYSYANTIRSWSSTNGSLFKSIYIKYKYTNPSIKLLSISIKCDTQTWKFHKKIKRKLCSILNKYVRNKWRSSSNCKTFLSRDLYLKVSFTPFSKDCTK